MKASALCVILAAAVFVSGDEGAISLVDKTDFFSKLEVEFVLETGHPHSSSTEVAPGKTGVIATPTLANVTSVTAYIINLRSSVKVFVQYPQERKACYELFGTFEDPHGGELEICNIP